MHRQIKNVKLLNLKIMEKVFRIKFYKDRMSIIKASMSKILIKNEEIAKMIAEKIAKEKNLFWQLEEFYI